MGTAAPVPKSSKRSTSPPSRKPSSSTSSTSFCIHGPVFELELSRASLIDLTSAGPQRVFGLVGKGRIAVGYDADFSVVDLKKRWTVEDDWLASRAGWSPFTGMTLTGRPIGTLIRGNVAMWEGALAPRPAGRPIRFQETEFA